MRCNHLVLPRAQVIECIHKLPQLMVHDLAVLGSPQACQLGRQDAHRDAVQACLGVFMIGPECRCQQLFCSVRSHVALRNLHTVARIVGSTKERFHSEPCAPWLPANQAQGMASTGGRGGDGVPHCCFASLLGVCRPWSVRCSLKT